MQITLSGIWTWVNNSISYNDNCCIKCASNKWDYMPVSWFKVTSFLVGLRISLQFLIYIVLSIYTHPSAMSTIQQKVKFLKRVKLEFSFSNLPYYLPIAYGSRRDYFGPFPRPLALSETQLCLGQA